ncbi:shikimate dehydrogenase family protein [Leucobacter chromiireducens]|uniref:shikimate dehydrogenase family protein n=1 Tax=Leucobacter chromiireducens TaxID=283877 RepID=UPI000F62CD98|nr:shikimate dehydrogenase [Leucobacter chromiireducens]
MPDQLAVLGWPIGHSLSPAIHRAAYEVLGVDWRYSAVRCGTAELAPFLAGRGAEWRGLSLTMPLKEEAHRLAASLDPVARDSGVVNTLRRRADGGWDGFNTDVAGLARAISAASLDAGRTLVIGTGATAISAVLAARQLGGAELLVVGRRLDAAAALAERFDGTGGMSCAAMALTDPDLPAWTPSLIISTLPGPAGAALELPSALTASPLFDVAYDPWPSPLAQRWGASGGRAFPGTDMLVEQAIVQIRIFRGGDPATPLPAESAVRAAMRAAAAPHGVGG